MPQYAGAPVRMVPGAPPLAQMQAMQAGVAPPNKRAKRQAGDKLIAPQVRF